MTSILILYGTTDGHTAKIASFVAETLTAPGTRADVVEARAGGPDPSPLPYDGVIVAASLHAGGYQRAVRGWLRRHAAELSGKPTLMLSVCLGVLQNDPRVRADLDAALERLFRQTGWRPATVRIVAGALPYSRYGWLKRLVMRRITRKAGVLTDPSRDYEFTDWDELRRMVIGFLAGVVVRRRVSRPAAA